MIFVRRLRKLLFGETWVLPLGIALAVGLTALSRLLVARGWWHEAQGLVLVILVLAALWGALRAGRG